MRTRFLIASLLTIVLAIPMAGTALAEASSTAAEDQVATTDVVTPPTEPTYSIPFPGKHANSVSFGNSFFGKGWDCTKYKVDGNFTQPNDFDGALAKYIDPDTGRWMLGVYVPAPKMYSHIGSFVWRMTCTDNTPPVLGAWRDLYVELRGPCEGSHYRIIARGDRANRSSTFVWEYEHANKGDQVASKTTQAGQRWWTNWREMELGSTMKASSPSTGETFFETVVGEDPRSCWEGVRPGVRY